MKTKIKNRNRKQLRAIVGTSLASASLFQLAFPFIANAEGIKAGTTISNTATATYDDGKGTTVEATSNTVQVTVAEVAGITNTPVGVVDPNGGSYEVNDYLDFKFKITNTGNSTTHFAIPNAATLKADGALTGVDQDDVTITAVKSDGTTAMTLSPYNTNYLVTDDTIAPDDYITVTVKVKVTATVAGNDIAVRFGDIAPNDNTSGTQNQAFSADTQKNDVYTVDAPDAVGSAPFDVADDSAGAPINGEREAAAYQKSGLSNPSQKIGFSESQENRCYQQHGC